MAASRIAIDSELASTVVDGDDTVVPFRTSKVTVNLAIFPYRLATEVEGLYWLFRLRSEGLVYVGLRESKLRPDLPQVKLFCEV